MKERMKKITVLSFYREQQEVTSYLQQLGVIHVESGRELYNEDIGSLESRKSRILKTIDTIEMAADIAGDGEKYEGNIDDLLDRIEDLRLNLDETRQAREGLMKELHKNEYWGDFDREKYAAIIERGIEFRFFIATRKQFKQTDLSGINYQVVNEAGDLVFLVVFKLSDEELDEVLLPFDEVDLSTPLHETRRRISKNEETEKELLHEIARYRTEVHALKDALIEIEDQLSYQYALVSQTAMGEGKLMVLHGWYPARIEKELTSKLDKRQLTYMVANPTPKDDVPVLLKNGNYSKLFEPITRIFQLPNYYELDLTPVIAVFYPIFFAYCLGDAGYGILVILLAILGWFTFLKNARNMVILALLLGVLTTIMGIIKSGSVFGLPLTVDSDVGLLSYLAQFVIIPDDQDYMFNAFNVSLMFGVLQILIGIIAAIANRIIYYSFKDALSQIGKLMIVVGVLVLFLADMQGVTELQPYSPVASILLYAGIGMVLLFHDMTVSVFQRIGSGILPLFFIFTGILGDILSYVRLFALGVASSVLGLVVNRIGMQIMGDAWWGVILAVLFLIFGHALNLALAALGAFVHPLRLTFVEFYNNAEFKGGGIEYKPFKKLKKDLNKS